ncbi:glutamine synthetase family protein [Oharaeibacter diazotrophicus]|uniref:L-glutamine synthetase n=1 Tax=Oharaeibacter diazotrophicus TaxID=1920512 RepID=A0A4R6RBS8_9HYPH|nr:glutamine synthetase family protein [Oharaeibacter diazotrophicus]TDP83590.1 L-glutamine synthetase [Oharaeibacter diazotrophicus]BBE72423.1 putative glutamine synthetase 2 [Pleomorphomonas sp. SM30]GLS79193.1 glutamine synthetase [Oharaeibacter diazotrophicus]
MPGNLTIDELKQEVAAGAIDTVNVVFIDMQGRLMGKRFHAAHFLDAHDETHACNYLLTVDIDMEPVPGYKAASWSKGYGDFVLKPDLATLRRTPWLPGTALVICDVQDHHHHDLPHSPRALLKKQIARLDAKGWKAYMASELEFYLFDETYASAGEKNWKQLKTFTSYIEDYGILPTTMEEPFMREIRNKLSAAGIRVENSKGEWGPGQEEINVRYADALTMADEHAIMKTGIKEMAHLQGKAVTFMSKYAYDLAGSSCHVHQSIWSKDGAPLFLDKAAEFGMSALMRQYLAGLLVHAREITWFLAPYINSYKRFQVGTFAPTKAIWSHDNRTAGFRLVGEETKAIRAECRIGGADINPHLAYAAMMAAGLAGIEGGYELEPAFTGDAYHGAGIREIPKTLREAIETLKGSEMLRKAFGDDVIEHYVHTAEWEQFEYDRRITDWELKRGFERY